MYSTPPLTAAVTVVGHGSVHLWLRSGTQYFDVFVRICDVDPRGRSVNVCDGIVRFDPGNVTADEAGIFEVEIPLWPTAREFAAGHRIRLQVSSAAHPLFSRNTGSGEPLGSATKLVPSYHEVLRSPPRASSIELPVTSL